MSTGGAVRAFSEWVLAYLLEVCIVVAVDKLTVLPDALRTWRKERGGISQETLAKRVDVTPGMIALIETGRRQPSLDLLKRIAQELDVPVGALAFLPADPIVAGDAEPPATTMPGAA